MLIHVICSKFYPYYSASDEKWKNSIRHNLSLYPEFVKGEKTTDGAGHLWYLDQDFRRNYLQQREERMRRKSEQMNEVLRHKNVEALVEDVMEEEEMKVKEAGTFYHEEAKYRDLITNPELQKSAEEILAGIKRPTAVIGNECFLDNYSFIATQDIFDREAWETENFIVPWQNMVVLMFNCEFSSRQSNYFAFHNANNLYFHLSFSI